MRIQAEINRDVERINNPEVKNMQTENAQNSATNPKNKISNNYITEEMSNNPPTIVTNAKLKNSKEKSANNPPTIVKKAKVTNAKVTSANNASIDSDLKNIKTAYDKVQVELQESLEKQSATIQKLSAKISTLNGKVDSKNAEVKRKNLEIEKLNKDLISMKEAKQQKETELAECVAAKTKCEGDLAGLETLAGEDGTGIKGEGGIRKAIETLREKIKSQAAKEGELTNKISDQESKIQEMKTILTGRTNEVKKILAKVDSIQETAETAEQALADTISNIASNNQNAKLANEANNQNVVNNKAAEFDKLFPPKDSTGKSIANNEIGIIPKKEFSNLAVTSNNQLARVKKENIPLRGGRRQQLYAMFGGGKKYSLKWRYVSHKVLFGGYARKSLDKMAKKWGVGNPTAFKRRNDLEKAMHLTMYGRYGDVSTRRSLNTTAKILGINTRKYKNKDSLYKAIYNKTNKMNYNLRGGKRTKK